MTKIKDPIEINDADFSCVSGRLIFHDIKDEETAYDVFVDGKISIETIISKLSETDLERVQKLSSQRLFDMQQEQPKPEPFNLFDRFSLSAVNDIVKPINNKIYKNVAQ